MKVLVFNGSPKGNKSDTIHMTKAFIEGMKTVTTIEEKIINVNEKKINHCLGCFVCMKNDGTCVQKDDMKEILEDILLADILIFSFPLYCYGMPAPLKNIIDRTMPLSKMTFIKENDKYRHLGRNDYSQKKYVMISGCGFPSKSNNFEAVTKQFELCFPNNHSMITVTESPLFNIKEASPVTIPFLEVVKQAGNEFIKDGKISTETIKKLSIPMIPEDIYSQMANETNK